MVLGHLNKNNIVDIRSGGAVCYSFVFDIISNHLVLADYVNMMTNTGSSSFRVQPRLAANNLT